MKDLSTFQIVLTAAFAVAAIAGVIVFATFRGGGGTGEIGEVLIWGTLDGAIMESVLSELSVENEDFRAVSYVEKDARTFDDEFVNALAAGTGPDLTFIDQNDILTHRDKIKLIPFESYSERLFKDTFIEEGELYLTETGILGFPFIVDPLVMYWNRDIFATKGISAPPKYWDEFFTLAPKVTERDQSSNILQSLVALGEYRNILHAKDILSTLMMQAGNPIILVRENGELRAVLDEKLGFSSLPAEAALRFYTEFSNPVKSVYSWNRALPNSRQSFLGGDLAVYFGFASELSLLLDSNPNLNFDVAPFPQSRDAERSVTFGRMQALAITRTSADPSSAFLVATTLTRSDILQKIADRTGLPPVHRDLLRTRPTDAENAIFYDAALIARAWLDPAPALTDGIFQRMIESTISGRARLREAIETADRELQNALR